jgi:AcrR family transcriptional regulator
MENSGGGHPPPVVKNARGRRRSHAARLTTQRAAPRGSADDASRRRPRGAEVRERVLQAALECFGAFGYEGSSTRAVAERAGVSHTLLLYHFASKEQLWRSTMDDVVTRYRAALAQRLARIEAGDAAAGLRAFVENFVRFSATAPQLYRIMTQESTQGSERITWLIDTHLREAYTEVRAIIERGQAAGRIRAGDPTRLYYGILGLAGTLLSVSTEFRLLTGRDVFGDTELQKTIDFIDAFVFEPA